ncbi:unnamed protein product, partial [Hapterophycus canaliculatus]
LEKQRLATEGSPDPLPPPTTGGFPRAEFFTSTMPHLPPHLASSYPYDHGDGAAGGSVTGGGGGGGAGGGGSKDNAGAPETECAVNVLAMERLGKNLMSLSQDCRGGRLSLETTLRLGAQMVSLLRMLHSTGYVHRDIKPENFCVGSGRHDDRVFLIDYGLACIAGDSEAVARARATATGGESDAARTTQNSAVTTTGAASSTVWVEVGKEEP